MSNGKYDFSNQENLGTLQEYENNDTSMIDITHDSIRVIQGGDAKQARRFIKTEEFRAYLEGLRSTPGYPKVVYTYNCVSAYIIALGALKSFSKAVRLLNKLLHTTYQSPDEYDDAIGNTLVLFTELVAEERVHNSYSEPVSRACAYIHDHLFVSIDPDLLAGYCGCSLSHLRHRFKDETGSSIVTYTQKNKIEKAKQMLKDSNYTIAQIGSQLDFCSQSYFINVFKRFAGCTPNQYRKKIGSKSID